MTAPRAEEILIAAVARCITDARHIAVGAASPVPGAAALLQRTLSGGATRVSMIHARYGNPFTDGGRELFDLVGQGRIDTFFLGGGEIDGAANINLVAVGGYPRPAVRFPGSFGAAYMYYLVPRVVLFREEHSRRTLVERVEFVTAPGSSEDHVYRPGGAVALVTGKASLSFDRARRRFRLESVHPGCTVEEVLDNTGFEIDWSPPVPATPMPPDEWLEALRGPIARDLAATYPRFAESAFGAVHER